ncbi:MAG TPA: hypothetical protein VJZ93_02700 [Candidatus Nanoarchaeia archaeon]|nr:hypothetical protein [Candidatus Nanoarchaeia archaeon]
MNNYLKNKVLENLAQEKNSRRKNSVDWLLIGLVAGIFAGVSTGNYFSTPRHYSTLGDEMILVYGKNEIYLEKH